MVFFENSISECDLFTLISALIKVGIIWNTTTHMYSSLSSSRYTEALLILLGSRRPPPRRKPHYKGLFNLTERFDEWRKNKEMRKSLGRRRGSFRGGVVRTISRGIEVLHVCSNTINGSHSQSYLTSVRELVGVQVGEIGTNA